VLAAHGVAPVVIDEGAAGRTDFRQPRPGLRSTSSPARRRGGNYRAPRALRCLRDRIDYRPQTLAWAIDDARCIRSRAARPPRSIRRADPATGATDRSLPIQGWTLPGVFTLGGAQVLLKEHGCLIGRRIVFCGSSPLLYLAARQYRAMGAEIVAVLDTTPFAAKVEAPATSAAAPGTLARGLGYMAALRRAACHASRRHAARVRGTAASKRCVSDVRHGRDHAACDAVASGSAQAGNAARRARRRSASTTITFSPMAAARRRGRRAAATSMWPATARRRRRAGCGAHRRACGVRVLEDHKIASPASIAARRAAGRAAAPVSARPRARLRLAGRRDPRSTTA
jgi:hypothetical protein